MPRLLATNRPGRGYRYHKSLSPMRQAPRLEWTSVDRQQSGSQSGTPVGGFTLCGHDVNIGHRVGIWISQDADVPM